MKTKNIRQASQQFFSSYLGDNQQFFSSQFGSQGKQREYRQNVGFLFIWLSIILYGQLVFLSFLPVPRIQLEPWTCYEPTIAPPLPPIATIASPFHLHHHPLPLITYHHCLLLTHYPPLQYPPSTSINTHCLPLMPHCYLTIAYY